MLKNQNQKIRLRLSTGRSPWRQNAFDPMGCYIRTNIQIQFLLWRTFVHGCLLLITPAAVFLDNFKPLPKMHIAVVHVFQNGNIPDSKIVKSILINLSWLNQERVFREFEENQNLKFDITSEQHREDTASFYNRQCYPRYLLNAVVFVWRRCLNS